MSNFIKSLIASLAVVLTFFGFMTESSYDKPIDPKNGGDPFIVEADGEYYYTYTTGGGIDIKQIKSPESAEVIREKTVFRAGEHGTDYDIWAPEIHKIDGRWYIVSCAKFKEDAVPKGSMPEGKETDFITDYYRYSFVLESKTEDIFGEYEFKGILAPDGLNTIDGTYLKKDGKLYFIYSAYMYTGYQNLQICEMENPYTLKTDEKGKHNCTVLSKPDLYWEKRGWSVNEAPAVLYKDGEIYLLYSASGFSSDNYCLGMLTLKGEDVTDKKSWCKSLTPVLKHQPLKKIYSPGHCSFLYCESGEIYMVYHANTTYEFDDSPRLTYVKPIEFRCSKPIFK